MKIKLILLILLFMRSVCHSQTWESYATIQGSGTTSMQMSSNGDLFFTTASYNYNIPGGQTAGVYRILNGSFLTAQINPTGGTGFNARTIETEGDLTFVSFWGNPSTTTETLYRSTNKGDSWSTSFTIGLSNNIFSIKADPDNNNVLIGARNGVYKSTNNGLSFTLSNTGMASNSWTYDIEKVGSKYLAATSNGLYQSTNNGDLWTNTIGIPITDTSKTLAVIPSATGDKIIAGTEDGNIYISDDDLFQYELLFGFENSDIIAMLVLLGIQPTEFNLFASAFPMNLDVLGNGLYYSYNGGTNWSNFGSGIPSPYKISALGGKISGSTITMYAGSFENTSNGVKIYKTSYTVGIKNLSSAIPENFTLHQNYPNPFNPSTKIRFDIQKASDVKLVVYNSLGKEISTLVNERLNAGTYETDFNAADYNSGVYFYKLFISGEQSFVETRKMILTK